MINSFIRKLTVGEKLIFFSGKLLLKIGSWILAYKKFGFWQLHYNKLEQKKIEVAFDGKELCYKTKDFTALARRFASDSLVFEGVMMEEEYKAAVDIFLLNNIPIKSFLDLGSNIGLTSVYVKNKFPDAMVIAIEPDKDNYEMMLRNFELNKLTNISPLMAGVGATDSFLEMNGAFRDEQQWALSFKEVGYPTDILSYSISTILKTYSIHEVDFIKMDIEGAEKEIFNDGADMSFLKKVKVLAIEIHDEFDIRNNIYRKLTDNDFVIFNSNETTIAVKRNLLLHTSRQEQYKIHN